MMKRANINRFSTIKLLLFFALICLVFLLGNSAIALDYSTDNSPFYYMFPRPNAKFVRPESTIVVRSDLIATTDLLQASNFSVVGSLSGEHQGETVLARDGSTVIFLPKEPFKPDESIQVTIKYPVQASHIGKAAEYTYTFNVTEPLDRPAPSDLPTEFQQQPVEEATDSIFQDFLTAPADIPLLNVEKWPGGDLGDGYIFIGPFGMVQSGEVVNYNLILDNNAEPIYYSRITDVVNSVDFKKQPNGLITYSSLTNSGWGFVGLNNNYQHVRDFTAGMNPNTGEVEYTADHHDLQILDNGNFLILIHDVQIVDMSEFGGDEKAEVIGCIVQEVDEDNFVVFQWNSWDEIPITDTYQPLDSNPLRYTHCNSIEEDSDGNLLLSNRNLEEITKIDRRTGKIIWRMGGRQNEFVFLNDDGFSVQHDARRLANGHMTLFDNVKEGEMKPSRGVEYRVDEVNKTVEKIAEFHSPEITENDGLYMGNLQRLANGNTVIGWGSSRTPLFTEFDKNGNRILEISVPRFFGSYRAFRFPWQGYPSWPPVLVAQLEGNTAHLYFSWNGSTETTGYKVFGGRDRGELTQLANVARDGFETTYTYDLPAGVSTAGFWYFRVVPFNAMGEDGIPSNVAFVVPGGGQVFLPAVSSYGSNEP